MHTEENKLQEINDFSWNFFSVKNALTKQCPRDKLQSIADNSKQEVKVIWQKAHHGGPIPRLRVTPGGRKLYHWIPGVGFPISVP